MEETSRTCSVVMLLCVSKWSGSSAKYHAIQHTHTHTHTHTHARTHTHRTYISGSFGGLLAGVVKIEFMSAVDYSAVDVGRQTHWVEALPHVFVVLVCEPVWYGVCGMVCVVWCLWCWEERRKQF